MIFGWCVLFMLVIIGLGRRALKKYALMLSELDSRLAQVEELLLEVCTLVEEESGEETLFSVVEAEQFPVAEEGEIPTEKAPLPEIWIQEAEPLKADSTPLAQTKSEEPVVFSTDQSAKQIKGKNEGTVKQQKLPEWKQQIIELHEKGLSVQAIARQIGKGQGEVQLVVDLYAQ